MQVLLAWFAKASSSTDAHATRKHGRYQHDGEGGKFKALCVLLNVTQIVIHNGAAISHKHNRHDEHDEGQNYSAG